MSQIFLVRSPALSSLDAEIKLELFSWRDHSATIPFFHTTSSPLHPTKLTTFYWNHGLIVVKTMYNWKKTSFYSNKDSTVKALFFY